MNLSHFYSGKRVMVTGHSGFKGFWLAAWLHRLGANIVGLSLPGELETNLFDPGSLPDTLTSLSGDIRDLPTVEDAFRAHRPEIVFHLAAQSLVLASYRDPVLTYDTNILGTVHVLEAIRHSPGVRAAVIVSSDKCYENREWVWGYRETDRLGGNDPYSSSKACVELVTTAYRHSFFAAKRDLAVASARAGNVIGGGDWSADRIIPDILRAVKDGRPVSLRHPDAVRPWQHVLDPLCGYLNLARFIWDDPDSCSQGWNFGPARMQSVSVENLTELFLDRWGSGEYQRGSVAAQEKEATQLRLDCSQALARLDWQPRLPLDDAVSWTVNWYRDYFDGSTAAFDLCESQIREYEDLAG